MKTAIITGASSGLGKEIVRQIADVFPEIECYWLIARRISCLDALADSLAGKKYYVPTRQGSEARFADRLAQIEAWRAAHQKDS